MEHDGTGRDEEIFVADFDGTIHASYIKDGDTRDTYGHIMAPLVIDGEDSFMAYAFNGFMRFDFDGNLISTVKIVDFENPNRLRMGMGYGLENWGDNYLYLYMGNKDVDYGAADFFDKYHTMSLLDPSTGKRESIVPIPRTSIFRMNTSFLEVHGNRFFTQRMTSFTWCLGWSPPFIFTIALAFLPLSPKFL